MLEGKRPPGERVVVYDAEGYFTGAGLAEKLAGDGFWSSSSPAWTIAPVCDETLEGPLLRQHLHDVGVGQRAGVVVTGIEAGA